MTNDGWSWFVNCNRIRAGWDLFKCSAQFFAKRKTGIELASAWRKESRLGKLYPRWLQPSSTSWSEQRSTSNALRAWIPWHGLAWCHRMRQGLCRERPTSWDAICKRLCIASSHPGLCLREKQMTLTFWLIFTTGSLVGPGKAAMSTC